MGEGVFSDKGVLAIIQILPDSFVFNNFKSTGTKKNNLKPHLYLKVLVILNNTCFSTSRKKIYFQILTHFYFNI